jgi:hypothetical protein
MVVTDVRCVRAFDKSLLFVASVFSLSFLHVSHHCQIACRISNSQYITLYICHMLTHCAIPIYSLVALWALLSNVYLVETTDVVARRYVLR